MESLYDYKKYQILYVDDEEKSLKYFRETFGGKFSILTALNAETGFKLLKENVDSIGILITDERMPGEKGIQLLEKARRLNPRILRILVTAYSDLETAIEAVNTGSIYKYVTKPWEIPQLEVTLKRGLEFFLVQKERDQLLQEKLSALYNLMLTDRILSLSVLAAGLGHHIRNSMVAMKNFLEMTPKKSAEENINLEKLRNADFWKEYYQKVQVQMDKVANLLSGLLEPSENDSYEFSDKVQLQQLVQEAIHGAKGELDRKQIKVENVISPSLPELKVDGGKFRKLFELILKKEISSLPMGGQVQFAAQLVGTREGNSEIQVQVEDNGPDLSQDSLRSILDPFIARTEDPQEFGVYLMTCFFIVYHHGGRISVSSSEGHGTVLTINLPLDVPSKTPAMEERDFISKVLINETMWEEILSGN